MIRNCIVALALALVMHKPVASQSYAAPGQSKQDYEAWAAQPAHAAAVASFKRYLRTNRVDGVIPTYQLLRTASSWQACGATPFAVAPASLWPAIARTLQLVRDRIEPEIGEVEALSGYREPVLNRCSGGAPASAHAQFYALDLTPRSAMSRDDMIARMCRLHARIGAAWAWGLGFYSGLRFHVDTKRYRRWGANGQGATSPCVAYDLR